MTAWIEGALRDARYALRTLRRSRGFTAVAVLTLGLGIGASTAIFSVVRAMLIAPLPYRESSQLVFVWTDLSSSGYPRAPLSGPELKDLRDRTTLFSDFGAIWATSAALTGDDNPEQLRIGLTTTNFFSMLGASAALGRAFAADDESPSGPRAILLSNALWKRRFGGDTALVGKRIQVNGQPATVVGVMPESFRLLMPPDANVPDDLQAWQLLGPNVLTRSARGQKYLRVVGRMKPGITIERARQDVNSVAEKLSREYAEYGASGRAFSTVGLQEDDVRQIRPALIALFVGVSLLLLIACVNVASLLVARAASRSRDTAVRLAIGAGVGRLVRQNLVEGIVLAGVGTVAGLIVGRWSLSALLALRPESLSRLDAARIDGTVLAFAVLTTGLAALIFSLAPAAELLHTDLSVTLQQEGRRAGGGINQRVRSALVVMQIALSVVLLVGAALMVRSFMAVQNVDPGFRPDHALSFKISVPGDKYPNRDAVNAFARVLQSRLSALPNVTGVGSVSHMPYDNVPNWGGPYITVKGADEAGAPFADNRSVSPGFFEAAGARLVEGRFFSEDDDPRTEPVVIVDEQLARRAWPGRSAIGQTIASDPFSTGHPLFWSTVVGVVGHLRHRSLLANLGDQIYFPERQVLRNPLAFVVRTGGDPAPIAQAARRVMHELDPTIQVYDIRPLSDYVVGARAAQRFTAILAATFAIVALLLASVGVYGVIAYATTLRRYEFGVRLALGAQPGQVIALVLREGARLAAIGLAMGAIGAALGARAISSQLYGVTPRDMASYAVPLLAIAVVVIAACWIPARRAAAISPLEAMRTD